MATGIARGDQNMGMPSGRYLEVFVMVPLFCAVALCALYRGSRGRQKGGLGSFFAWIWLCVEVFGFSIHIFYRTLPFIAHENGEWNWRDLAVMFRETSRGVEHPYYSFSDPLLDESVDTVMPKEMLQGQHSYSSHDSSDDNRI